MTRKRIAPETATQVIHRRMAMFKGFLIHYLQLLQRDGQSILAKTQLKGFLNFSSVFFLSLADGVAKLAWGESFCSLKILAIDEHSVFPYMIAFIAK